MKLIDIKSVGDRFILFESNPQDNTATGLIIVRNLDGDQLTSFHLKLVVDPKAKHRFPRISEVTPTLPFSDDRHINEDGTFCLAMIHKEILLCMRGMTFESFVDSVLYPFLTNQYLIETGEVDSFLMGEYQHKEHGILQYYQELFPGLSINQLLTIISFIGKNNITRRLTFRCPCGSGRHVNYCHYDLLRELKSMGSDRIRDDFAAINSIYESQTVPEKHVL